MDFTQAKTSTTGVLTFEGIAYEVIKKRQGELYSVYGKVIPVQRVLNDILRHYDILIKEANEKSI